MDGEATAELAISMRLITVMKMNSNSCHNQARISYYCKEHFHIWLTHRAGIILEAHTRVHNETSYTEASAGQWLSSTQTING